MTGIPKKRKGYGQIVKNGDKNGGEGCRLTDAEGSDGVPAIREMAVCFRKQVQRFGELTPNFD